MFKGRLASSETAKSIMETQTLVADIGYDCIVKEALNLDLSPEKVTILQGHLNLVPLSITALSTSLSSLFTSADSSDTTLTTCPQRKEYDEKANGKTTTP